MNNPKSKILIFLALTVALCMFTWIPIIRAGDVALGNGMYVLATMWCPGVAAILTRLITQGNLKGMGWKPRTLPLLGLAYILPVLYAAPVYLATWGLGFGGFDLSKWQLEPGMSPAMGLLILASMGAVTGLMSATGEEIGWRGLLVPELAKIATFRTTALVSGVIWASFHFPLIIGANYRAAGTPLLYNMACFTLMIVALSVILAWVTIRSGSLWPAALMHATHNLFIQAVFDRATVNNATTPWIIGEFGFGLVITVTIAAALLLHFGGVPKTPIAEGK